MRAPSEVGERYLVSLEVAGPVAMFSRPDTGATPISYPVPTWSAAKGMFDAVAWKPHVSVHPTWVEICKPIRYERYVTNYGGPLRSKSQQKGGNNYQLYATILVDVCYRVYGEIRAKTTSAGRAGSPPRRRRGRQWGALFQQLFSTRLKTGQTFYTPCLGWKEFVPSYFGPLRTATKPDRAITLVIPSLLHSMWEHRRLKPRFRQDWHIIDGVMSYEHQRPPEVPHAE